MSSSYDPGYADACSIALRSVSAALSEETAKLTHLMDNTHALLTILTSDAAADMHPMLKMAINGFMRSHPEVAPK